MVKISSAIHRNDSTASNFTLSCPLALYQIVVKLSGNKHQSLCPPLFRHFFVYFFTMQIPLIDIRDDLVLICQRSKPSCLTGPVFNHSYPKVTAVLARQVFVSFANKNVLIFWIVFLIRRFSHLVGNCFNSEMREQSFQPCRNLVYTQPLPPPASVTPPLPAASQGVVKSGP